MGETRIKEREPALKKKEKQPGAWLTIEEVAGIMDVSRDTVTRLIVSGSLPAVLIHSGKKKKTFRIRPETFRAWGASRERGPEQSEGKTVMRRPRLRVPMGGSNSLNSALKWNRAPNDAEKTF